MKQKIKGILLVCTLLMACAAVLPAGAAPMAQTSYDMEEWETVGGLDVPKGFTVTPGTGAEISCDETNVAGNTSKKLKIVHTENTTTTVSVHVLDADAPNTPCGVYWSFFLGDDFAGTGVKLYSMRGEKRETNYFTDKSYTWWRKMMVYHSSYAYQSDYVAEFTGTGTVYLDDVTWELTKIINGGFEGVCGDGLLSGAVQASGVANGANGNASTASTGSGNVVWKINGGDIQFLSTRDDTNPSALTGGSIYFVETASGNYMDFVNASRTAMYITYIGPAPTTCLTANTYYCLRAYSRSNNGLNGLRIYKYTSGGFAIPTVANNYYFTDASLDWTEKRFYSFFNCYGSGNRLMLVLAASNSGADPVPVVGLDNVSMEEADESCTLTAGGNTITTLPNGEAVTVTFEKPLFDSTKDTFAEFTQAGVNGATSTDAVAVVAALYDVSSGTPVLTDLKLTQELHANAVFEGMVHKGTKDTLGFLPATFTQSFDIPAEGAYALKVIALDSMSTLHPAGNQVYTFRTAAQE